MSMGSLKIGEIDLLKEIEVNLYVNAMLEHIYAVNTDNYPEFLEDHHKPITQIIRDDYLIL